MSDDKYNITREHVLEMMFEDREKAHQVGEVRAAISVTKMFGDSIGLFKPAETPTAVVNNYVRPFTKQDMDLLEALGMDFATTKIDPKG